MLRLKSFALGRLPGVLTIHWPKLIVILIAAASLWLWLKGTAWGQPYAFQSDEWRFLSRVVDNPAVPIWTIYGRWPIYTQRLAAALTGLPTTDLLLARTTAALISVAGLLATALATAQIAGWKAAALAAALLAGAPLVVQTANFFITDVWLYAGVAAAIWLSLRQAMHGQWRTALALGLVWGMAIGSKLSGLFLFPAIIWAFWIGPSRHRWRKLAVAVALAALVGLAGQPTLLVNGLNAYLKQGELLTHLNVAAGLIRPSYTLQFVDTPTWTYYISPVLWWGAGPLLTILGLTGIAGGLLVCVRHFRSVLARNQPVALHLIWLSAFGAIYLMSAGQFSKYTRYALPLLPSLAIGASWLVMRATQRLSNTPATISLLILGAVALLPGLFFARVHQQLDTRLQAALWIGDHVPANAAICHEPDVGYAVPPIGLGGPAYASTAQRNYRSVLLNWGALYAASDFLRQTQPQPVIDTPEQQPLRIDAQQTAQIEAWLAACDWLVVSDRFADQFLPLADIWPAIGGFYRELLGNHRSDFHLVAEFRSLPGWQDFTIDDRSAELTFRSFDHPTIWIFKR
ncbi:MAG: glycosyltransferase family 39 protein [Thermoflexales bacterium]|nr:glycosyltransferase family 39 protein [Thermoflexales bacterium]